MPICIYGANSDPKRSLIVTENATARLPLRGACDRQPLACDLPSEELAWAAFLVYDRWPSAPCTIPARSWRPNDCPIPTGNIHNLFK